MSTAQNPAQLHPGNQRIVWADLPLPLRRRLEETLGSPVLTARSQTGGFSLGTADRLLTKDGQGAFLKAVSASLHPGTTDLHRQEAKVSAAFPAEAPVPGFIDFCEYKDPDGEAWVALLLEDVEGKHPGNPWQADQLRAVFTALDALRDYPVDPALKLESATESVGPELRFWHRLSEGVEQGNLQYLAGTSRYRELSGFLPFINEHATEFAGYVDEHLIAHLAGTEYVHTDLRADNILLTGQGQAVLVDWPWANIGNADLDLAQVAADALGQDTALTEQQVLTLMPEARRPAPAFLHATVISLAGYYLYASTQPPQASTNASLIEVRAERAAALLRRLTR